MGHHKRKIYMLKPRHILSCAALLSAIAVMAVPARRGIYTVTQPDGTTLRISKVGDERIHFDITEDGDLLYQADDGAFYYGKLDASQNVVSTGVMPGTPTARSAAFTPVKLADIDIDAVCKAREANPTYRRDLHKAPANATTTTLPQTGLGLFQSSFPSTGEINTLIVLVEYQDIKFSVSDPASYYDKFFHENGFSQHGGTGCVKQYFVDNSMGQFTPNFEVYGPITLANNRSYYGANNSAGDDMHPAEMVSEACDQLDDIIDFTRYDMNNDGLIDNVYIFYAGVGEATSGVKASVWPHQYDVRQYSINKTYDGKTLAAYGCCNEWDNSGSKPDGIGTFVHEFSHVLGLPDLYSTSYNSYQTKTPGSWSVLDYACYNNNSRTPAGYSIYERNAMGWIVPTVLGSPADITLQNIAVSNVGCIIQTDKTNEFFLFENRQKTGWDKYLPGHGMMVWHIDYNSSVWTANTVNNQAHQYVDIVEANNMSDNTSSTYMAGYPFPGTYNVTTLTSTTTPALKTWAGTAIDCPITDIAETDGVITFKVAGGKKLLAPEPVIGDVTADYFDITWHAVDDATDYAVTVQYKGEVSEPTVYSADMGSGTALSLPAGWSSSSTNVYSSVGYYGAAAPSYLMASNAAWLTTAQYNGDIQEVSFWLRLSAYSANQSPSTLDVYGLVGNSWQKLETISPTDNLAHTYTINDKIPVGTTQLKFQYNRVYGNMAIDDVNVTVGGSPVITLDGYDGKMTGGATTVRVSGLESGVDTYYVTVTASNDDYASEPSQSLVVTLPTTGVENITVTPADTDSAAVYYTLSGVRVDASRLTPGIYVKVAGTTATKVVVK